MDKFKTGSQIVERKKSSYLETLTNVAVILVAVTVISTLVLNYYELRRAPNMQTGLQRGSVLAQLPNTDYQASPQTLLIALDTKCSYCQDGIPFYNSLLAAQKSSASSTRIIAIFPNSKKEVTNFLQQNQLNLETIGEVKFNPLRISGTPTMILVNADGRVENFWIGKITPPQEAQVIADVFLKTP